MSRPPLKPSSLPEPATLVELLRRRASDDPDRPAFTFLLDGESESLTVTYAELDERVRAIAVRLVSIAKPGDRALILYPPGLDFVAAFFACLYAGLVAVPAYPIDDARRHRTRARLEGMLGDAHPHLALAPRPVDPASAQSAADLLQRVQWIDVQTVDLKAAAAWRDPGVSGDSLAVIQYTSGSTCVPRGVMLRHRNIMANLPMFQHSYGTTRDSVIGSWLPVAHDMGLFGRVVFPVYLAARAVLMTPELFVEKPLRWLQMIARHGVTAVGAPDSSYDLCIRKTTLESRRGLDLSGWHTATIGGGPARSQTIDRFVEVFGPYGMKREAFCNGYGLAEATLSVCGARDPRVVRIERDAVESGVLRLDPPLVTPSKLLVSAGTPPPGERILIADPRTCRTMGENELGEVWVSGPHVAAGYWNKPDESVATFEAFTSDSGEGPFLRTGDLGFVNNGELFIAGRLKDLIIIDGRNIYPEDVEATVNQCHPALRAGFTAAFGLDDWGEEHLVIVQEVREGSTGSLEDVVARVRARVADEHELLAHAVILVRAGTLPRTANGKPQRRACRAAYVEGTLDVVSASVLTGLSAEADQRAVFTPPRNATESAIVRVWQSVLGVTRVGIHDNFVDLGGQSIQATQCIARLDRTLGVRLSPGEFFSESATPEAMAHKIDRLSSGASPAGTAAAR